MSWRAAIQGAWTGKTIGRALTNEILTQHLATLSGRVLDVAGGVAPSYLRLIPRNVELVRTNRMASPGVDQLDFNQPFCFPDASFDAVLSMHALYIADNPTALLLEMRRVLRPGGTMLLVVPFIANEMPEPHDYVRFTAEGLERLCLSAGFSLIKIERIGERGSAALHLLMPFLPWKILRLPAYLIAVGIDRIIPKRVRQTHPTPLSYLVLAR